MDKINTSLLILTVSGIITLAVGCSYIPTTGGTVPQGETPDDFSRRQQEAVFNSSGFKTTMIGTGITVASVLGLWIRSCIFDYRLVNYTVKEPRSILKVKRSTIVPQIEIIVEDPKPQVQADPRPQIRTTPNLIPLAAPSSSPPIQLIPSKVTFMELQPRPFKGPVIEKIRFKYPPPYDVLNRQ